METGERLAAYVAGDLDADERAELEAELARDPALRRQLALIERADTALRDLAEVNPPPGFSLRLHDRLATELATTPRDELAVRRPARAAWRPFVTAAAAAAVLVVVGLGGGILLRGGGAANDGGTTMADGSGVVPIETDNDYNPQELERLAVGVDLGVPADMDAVEASAAAENAVPGGPEPMGAGAEGAEAEGAGEGGSTGGGAEPPAGGNADDQGSDRAPRAESTEGTAAQAQFAANDPVATCLQQLLEGTTDPLVLAHVEIARYEGEPAIIYVFAALDPSSGEYRRAVVYAMAREDCFLLTVVQYDQPPRPGN